MANELRLMMNVQKKREKRTEVLANANNITDLRLKGIKLFTIITFFCSQWEFLREFYNVFTEQQNLSQLKVLINPYNCLLKNANVLIKTTNG